jgi:threonine aldolase
VPLNGESGKLVPSELDDAISSHIIGEPHHSQPAVVTIAQSTEAGTVYTPDEVMAISEVTKKHNLTLHMDGARFTNALVKIGCSPAEMTWKAGVDALSFGTTKNGTLGAEAALFFNDTEDGSFKYRRMRGGHLLSKMRFVSAQIIAYLEDDLWLKNATHANAMADRLYQGTKDSRKINFVDPIDSNVMFADIDESLQSKLNGAGFKFYASGKRVRLVTAFNTDVDYIDDFISLVNKK